MIEIEIIEGVFSISQIPSFSDVPDGEFVFAAKTDSEISLVCLEDSVPASACRTDGGWNMFRISGQLDFSLVGILAKITSVLAGSEIPVFAVSTYDTDYILIRKDKFKAALDRLSDAGYLIR